MKVGGQAVIEGVMMRSPNSMTTVVRRPTGEIIIKEQPWISIWNRLKFLKWPFLRGAIVLVESLYNGIQALTFSANQAVEDEEGKDEKLSTAALVGTVTFAMAMGLVLFLVIPHLLTQLFGGLFPHEITVNSIWFHLIDGFIKITFFILYVWGISMFKDIRRVFEYHGAEHMSIFAYEKGVALTVEKVRQFITFHPRCGTSFLMFVILISILLFSAIFPLLPALEGMPKYLRHLVYIAIKLPLMFPIAGISYELIKLAGKRENNKLLQMIIQPGIWMQHITTKPPSDDQLEVAILSLAKVLWREKVGDAGGEASEEVYVDFNHAIAAIGANN